MLYAVGTVKPVGLGRQDVAAKGAGPGKQRNLPGTRGGFRRSGRSMGADRRRACFWGKPLVVVHGVLADCGATLAGRILGRLPAPGTRYVLVDDVLATGATKAEAVTFLEWLAEKYQDFGAALEFVSDRSSEGNQFVKGFGGIGAILRYTVNFEQLADFSDEDEFYDDDDE